MHWGRQCTDPNELPDAGLGDALKGASLGLCGGVNAFFYILSCWLGVKIRKGWLKLYGFQCIKGGGVPAPMSCQMLGRAMRQKACRLALAEVCMHFSVFFLVCNVWESALHGYKSGGNAV